MKSTVFAAPLPQTALALTGMAIPVLCAHVAGPGGAAALAGAAARSAATLAPTVFNYLLAIAAALGAAG